MVDNQTYLMLQIIDLAKDDAWMFYEIKACPTVEQSKRNHSFNVQILVQEYY